MLSITSFIPAGKLKGKYLVYISTLLLFITIIGVLHLSSNTDPLGLFTDETGVEQGCYWLYTASDQMLLSEEKRKERNCSQSFPDALIIGTKKCGTTALRNFLTFHPQMATSKDELHFFENRYHLGIDWYLSQMPYATPDQITLEKTPRYFVHPLSPRAIRTHLGQERKFILILRDPVQRAISDFTHVFQDKITKSDTAQKGDSPSQKMRKMIGAMEDTLTDEQKTIRTYVERLDRKYRLPAKIADTFEDTVLFPNGSVNSATSIVDTSIYSKYMKKWLALFPPEQFLVLDGEEFVYNPLPALQKVETFLNISSFYTHDTFYFDLEKRFFCLAQPFRSCMRGSKGRTHPLVKQDVVEKLRDFYRPYNLELAKLMNLNFPWLSI